MTRPARLRLLWTARPDQAMLEGVLLLLALLLALWLVLPEIGGQDARQGFWFVGPVAATWTAMRLRLPKKRWRPTWSELGLTAFFTVLLLSLIPLATHELAPYMQAEERSFPDVHDYFILFLVGFGFAALRIAFRIWQWWDSLRRQHLVWGLTHGHLTLAALVALPFILLFIVITVNSTYVQTVVAEQSGVAGSVAMRIIIGVIPVLVSVALLVAAGLAVVLPPAALVSYLVARRTVRRLESLTQTTAAMRGGDLGARVTVVGEDEVAQLQADYNAMADHLQETLQALQAERDKVTALLATQRELTASVSHELRTPIATIQGYLEPLASRYSDDAPAGLQEELAVIEAEIGRLSCMVDDLFSLSRAELGQLSLELTPVELPALAERVVGTLTPLAWERGRVEVLTDLPTDLPQVQADAGRLEQVLINLLRNGVRHTPPGGIVVLAAAPDEQTLRIEVRDTGNGIPAEELPLIWQRFFRGSAGDRSGAGLGLAVVKELVEAMNGRVAVQSVVGEGSIFSIWLPVA